MPSALTYPGVYIEEVPSGVRTITGVATAITAFIGRALRGPVDDPVRVQSFAEFTRRFGGLWVDSTMSYAVQQYFANGGSDAIIVRVHRLSAPNADDFSTASLAAASGNPLVLESFDPGLWGDNLRAVVDHNTATADTELFNLTIREVDPVTGQLLQEEVFRNLKVATDASRYVNKVLEQESSLVRVRASAAAATARPNPSTITNGVPTPTPFTGGDNGLSIVNDDISHPDLEAQKHGIWALDKADLFNILCISPLTRDVDVDPATTLTAAVDYCAKRRAMLLIDPPATWNEASDAVTGINSSTLNGNKKNAAIFFPRVKMPDSLQEGRTQEFAPCGVIAGIFARTDAQRGVWKAPAGLEAAMNGVRELTVKLTDGESGRLNPLGVNCLRTFAGFGNVVWGARTLDGADRLASEWKYISVRRTALFIEETLYRGTQWVVFEPNDEPLWAQIRLNIGAFMQGLFRQGAFQGKSPREAYFVKCDSETTTQNDINLGIVNIVVGFAPLKPAEFVILKIQQMAGQIAT